MTVKCAVLSDIVDTFFSSVVVGIPNDTFWVVPKLHSVIDISVIVRDDTARKCLFLAQTVRVVVFLNAM